MEEKVLHKLEYGHIIEMLVECCVSTYGKELARELKPILNQKKIKQWQLNTTQGKEILRLYPDFSLGGVRDIRSALGKAKIGGVLDPSDFLLIGDTLSAMRQIKNFFTGENGIKYDSLVQFIDHLTPPFSLGQEIRDKITPEGTVSDQASVELARLRKQLNRLRSKGRGKLENMLRTAEIQKYLQEPLITVRNERYVLPVKQEYRTMIPGIIHDQSASGATLFVEPSASVEINNEVRRYEAMERTEVLRILRDLSKLVAIHGEELQQIVFSLAQLDLALAKGKLSLHIDGGEPLFNNRGVLKITQGKHPLLSGKVVPLTIYLGDTFDTLIITGPNTGGKTVALKTVGLFVLMAQAGLHIPAQTGTELPVFTNVYADIGDEQSIEQSLSTFSAHLTNIIRIVNKANKDSLVLLDELGAGTDPAEGAALAKAILTYFITGRVKTIATTHYSELKSFAYTQERVENASMEFNLETLQPTFRLLLGIPGRSNALEIASKLGLPVTLVEKAKGYLSQMEVRSVDLIANLEREKLLAEKENAAVQQLRMEMQGKIAQLQQREDNFQQKASQIRENAKKEALAIIKEARQEGEQFLQQIKKAKKEEGTAIITQIQSQKRELEEKEKALTRNIEEHSKNELLDKDVVKLGMIFFLKKLNQPVQVLAEPDENEQVLVQAGIMKVFVNLSDLAKIPKEKTITETRNSSSGSGKITLEKAKTINSEIHLRGLTVDDALLQAEKYLDDAYLAGLSPVRLIHGKGTGVLRKAITNLLKTHHLVSSFRLGTYHEGGHGVTVVELKKQ